MPDLQTLCYKNILLFKFPTYLNLEAHNLTFFDEASIF